MVGSGTEKLKGKRWNDAWVQLSNWLIRTLSAVGKDKEKEPC